MIYGNYNDNGEYLGFYIDEIHDVIPEPNIKLTEEEWKLALTGNYKVIDGKNTEYTPEKQSDESLLKDIRNYRNYLLSECDWTQLPDCKLKDDKRNEWIIYRQLLRDITNSCDIHNIEYPIKPL